MQKKQKKNVLLQRIDFIIEKNNDTYLKLCNDQMQINVKAALKMSILDEDIRIEPFRRGPSSKYKNKPKLVIDQINKYLKAEYHKECYCKSLKKDLKPLIIQGQLCDSNINWVILELSGARVMRIQNKDAFHQLLSMQNQYPYDLFEPIYLDVVRTISKSQRRLEEEDNIKQILIAYAIRNPEIGYCQGQNFVAHFLVNGLKFSVEDAFWIYTQILETVMPLDYYTNILSTIADQKILEYYIEQYLPDLNNHFTKIGLQVDFFSVQWYLCIFTNQVHQQLSSYVLLMLLLDGIKALTISSLILLMMLKVELLKFKQFTDVKEYISNYIENFKDIEVFRHYYNSIKIKKKAFYYAREEIRSQLMKQHEQRLSQKQLDELDKLPPCPEGQPICNQQQLSHSFMRRSPSFFVYREKYAPKVIPNYFEGNVFSETQKRNDVLVLRQEHIQYQEVKRDQPIKVDEKKLTFMTLSEQIQEQEKLDALLHPEVTKMERKKQTKPNIYEKTKPMTDEEEYVEESGFKQEIFNEEDFDYFQYYGQLREIEDKKMKIEKEHIKQFKSSRSQLIIDSQPSIVVYKESNPEKKQQINVIKFKKKFLEDQVQEEKKKESLLAEDVLKKKVKLVDSD